MALPKRAAGAQNAEFHLSLHEGVEFPTDECKDDFLRTKIS